ncbi:UDPglucose--hexose-1-phosphate uridylyltransferase [Anaerovirgula multivorans]|uniref:Galactose-1-phosphate uridylyltransferase n=1 Tax=Anaerovirgula multivorans TaxID=312168 RepID=A0A239BGM7_9FIRM|nr:galactose-1-phosphate uridylyltransferase [Anaerovirgula multivorans]SNS06508.1 UDPglucose--hexose-1-phosphate uridylyltransferase [Anaerovirgula multivorans]
MSEFRKDPFTNRQVIIAQERGRRPNATQSGEDSELEKNQYEEKCFFCLGNENLTPQETFEIKNNEHWLVRVFPNKFPILLSNNEANDHDKEELFEAVRGKGIHEVIVDHYAHNKHFFNMTRDEFGNMLLAYKNRYNACYGVEDTAYVSLFKNFLKKAGASLSHPHSQIISMPIIPQEILIEVENCDRFYEKNKKSLHEAVIIKERNKNERLIYENKNFVVMAPFASMYNYEVEIIHKHIGLFKDMDEELMNELSEVFYLLFQKYNEVLGPIPFNLFLHTPPKNHEKAKFHWHFHITPRLSNQAGFELSTGVYVNAVSPEDAANDLRITSRGKNDISYDGMNLNII